MRSGHSPWKTAIAAELAILLDITDNQALKAVNAVFYTMKDALLHGERVEVYGLGTLKWRTTKARRHYLSLYDSMETLPQRNHVIFKPSQSLLRFINQ